LALIMRSSLALHAVRKHLPRLRTWFNSGAHKAEADSAHLSDRTLNVRECLVLLKSKQLVRGGLFFHQELALLADVLRSTCIGCFLSAEEATQWAHQHAEGLNSFMECEVVFPQFAKAVVVYALAAARDGSGGGGGSCESESAPRSSPISATDTAQIVDDMLKSIPD